VGFSAFARRARRAPSHTALVVGFASWGSEGSGLFEIALFCPR